MAPGIFSVSAGPPCQALIAKGWEVGGSRLGTVLFVTGPENSLLHETLPSKGVLPEDIDVVVLNRLSLPHAGLVFQVNGRPICHSLRYPKARHLISRQDLKAVGERHPIVQFLEGRKRLITVDGMTAPILGPRVYFCDGPDGDQGGSEATYAEIIMASGWIVLRDGAISLRGLGSKDEVSCPDGIHCPSEIWPVQMHRPSSLAISAVISAIASVRDQGVREGQEDRVLVREIAGGPGIIAVVADGHGHLGRLASRLSASAFYERAALNILQGRYSIEEGLRQAVMVADRRVCRFIFHAAKRDRCRIGGGNLIDLDSGSTLLALVQTQDQLTLVHVGDSRAYLLRRGDVSIDRALTTDQVWERGDEGVKQQGEIFYKHLWAMRSAMGHPILRESLRDRPKYRAWPEKGIWPQPVITPLNDIRPGDRIVLSSDGLNYGSPGETARFLGSHFPRDGNLHEGLNSLMRGWQPWGSDNTSVVVVEVGG